LRNFVSLRKRDELESYNALSDGGDGTTMQETIPAKVFKSHGAESGQNSKRASRVLEAANNGHGHRGHSPVGENQRSEGASFLKVPLRKVAPEIVVPNVTSVFEKPKSLFEERIQNQAKQNQAKSLQESKRKSISSTTDSEPMTNQPQTVLDGVNNSAAGQQEGRPGGYLQISGGERQSTASVDSNQRYVNG
jgi:hypothetical protein